MHCEEEEEDNEYAKHAVGIIYDSFHSNKVVGHVSQFIEVNWPTDFWTITFVFLLLRIVNRDIALDLEIPVGCFFDGDNRVI